MAEASGAPGSTWRGSGSGGSLTDVPGIRVGHWTDLEHRTGCTVVLAPSTGAVASMDVRGGAPGTHNTELLRPSNLVQRVHALVLTGGSAFGLATTAGVMRYLQEQVVGLSYGAAIVPIVCGAVLFDLAVASGPAPNGDAGYAASVAAAAPVGERGSVGAGTGATVGKALGVSGAMRGGLGMASRRAGAHVVAGLVVVNAFGDVVDAEGRILAGARRPDGRFFDTVDFVMTNGKLRPEPGNTTLGIVATTARLSKEEVNRVTQMAHDGFARAIRPAHTMVDGDIIFGLSVAADDAPQADASAIGVIAAEVMRDSILDAVRSATGTSQIPAVRDFSR